MSSTRFSLLDASGNALPDGSANWVFVKDTQLNLDWARTLPTKMTDTDAVTACTAQGCRLPTLVELESLRDITLYKPAIAAAFASDTQIDVEYRTSDSAAEGGTDCAWIVSFAYGFASIGGRTVPLWVRPVKASS